METEFVFCDFHVNLYYENVEYISIYIALISFINCLHKK